MKPSQIEFRKGIGITNTCYVTQIQACKCSSIRYFLTSEWEKENIRIYLFQAYIDNSLKWCLTWYFYAFV